MHRQTLWTLALLFTVACASPPEAPAPEAETAPMPVPDVRGEEVSYEVDGVSLTGYLAYDAAQEGPRPGVLVVHEWWGHNEYARRRARMLAEMGYTAMAVDMYGDGKLADHPEDAMKFMTEALSQLDVAAARFRAARAVLEGHSTTDSERTAAIGYCFGGGVVLYMARAGEDLDGVASFHGSLATENPAQPGGVSARILVLNGAADPWVTEENIEAFEAEMEAAGADMKLISYEGALHSFTSRDATELGERFEMPMAYHPEADAQSWAELETFLTEIFS